METITERLSLLIDKKGIKAVELASATSVNTSTISRVLKGTQIPTADTLYKFAQYFNVTMEYLLTGNTPTNKNCEYANFTKDKLQLLEYYDNMKKEDQIELIQIAQIKSNKGKGQKSSLSQNDTSVFETA